MTVEMKIRQQEKSWGYESESTLGTVVTYLSERIGLGFHVTIDKDFDLERFRCLLLETTGIAATIGDTSIRSR